MEVTGLEGLVVALGGTLVDLFVVALVVIMTLAIAVFATDLLLVVVLTIRIAALVAAIVVPLALIYEVANLVFIAPHQFVVEFAFDCYFICY